MIKRSFYAFLLAIMLSIVLPNLSLAADFYKDKTIDIYVGTAPGGGYDAYARLVARHYGDVIPGHPSFVVRNMPGASSLRMLNFLYNIPPKDGTVIGTPEDGAALEPLFKVMGGAQFDAMKFNWIGGITKEVALITVWHTQPIHNFDDLRTKGMVGGAVGAMSDGAIFARMMNALAGTKIKVIVGYKGNAAALLAMERGELMGMPGWDFSSILARKWKWLQEKKIRIIGQTALHKDPRLPNVPLTLDYAKRPEDRAVMELIATGLALGRPYVAPPSVPSGRVSILRRSFNKLMTNKKFVADAKKRHIDINPSTGEEMVDVLKKAYSAPTKIVKRAHDILASRTGLSVKH